MFFSTSSYSSSCPVNSPSDPENVLQTLWKECNGIQKGCPPDTDEILLISSLKSYTEEERPSRLSAETQRLLEKLRDLSKRQTDVLPAQNTDLSLLANTSATASQIQQTYMDLTKTLQDVNALQPTPRLKQFWLVIKMLLLQALLLAATATALLYTLCSTNLLFQVTAIIALVLIMRGFVPHLFQTIFDLTKLEDALQASKQNSLNTTLENLKNLLNAQLRIVNELQNQYCDAFF